MKTILIHLSDIHFGKPRHQGIFDLDRGLRDEVERDLTDLRATLGPARGIIVSGDIAFSGQADQYSTALEWLSKVTEIVGCDRSSVWVTPGNHDIDRTVVRSSEALKDFHALVRSRGAASVDEQLSRKAQDPVIGPVLLAAMKNYNDFAAKFECEVASDQLTWRSDIVLNDNSTLRMVGLTSTWLSDELDNDGANKLAIGAAQLHLPRLSGVEYLTVCHHPPQWLLDQDSVETTLRANARIHLFGHKHRPDTYQVNDSVCLTAGAVHPDRAETNWTPQYNLICLEVQQGSERTLHVEVLRCVWDDGTKRFSPAGAGMQAYDLPLPAFVQTPIAPAQVAAAVVMRSSGGTAVQSPPAPAMRDQMDHNRTLVYRFLTLPLHKRIEVCHTIGLLPEGAALDSSFFTQVFKTAKDSGLLAQLWDKVEAERGGGDPNPFRDVAGG